MRSKLFLRWNNRESLFLVRHGARLASRLCQIWLHIAPWSKVRSVDGICWGMGGRWQMAAATLRVWLAVGRKKPSKNVVRSELKFSVRRNHRRNHGCFGAWIKAKRIALTVRGGDSDRSIDGCFLKGDMGIMKKDVLGSWSFVWSFKFL